MKFLAFLILLSALAIAGCAAYFSIVGLTLLFVGSGTSIIVMGIALEIGKIIAVSFLKQRWEVISLSLKAYLVAATIILMGITSLGIYGYLSAGYNATAVKVQGYDQQIDSNNKKIEELKSDNTQLQADDPYTKEIENYAIVKGRYELLQQNQLSLKESKISYIRTSGTADKKSTDDMNAAKSALDSEKVTLDVDINKELKQIELYNKRLEILDREVQTWLDQGTGGIFKKNGIDKARVVKNLQEKERNQIDDQIKDCQTRIELLRKNYKEQVDKYNERIKGIEGRLAMQNTDAAKAIAALEQEIAAIRKDLEEYNKNTTNQVAEQNAKKQLVIQSNKDKVVINEQTIQKLLTDNNQIKEQIVHTDVGTFKFVAKSLDIELDKIVNYFIWAIMLVFDPLAVCLILCFNYLIKELNNSVAPVAILPSTPSVTPSVSIQEMTTYELFTGKKAPVPVPTPEQAAETKRISDIYEAQRLEREARKAKQKS